MKLLKSISIRIIRRLQDSELRELLYNLVHELNHRSNSYFTYHERPKRLANNSSSNTHEDVGILIQGPIKPDDKFILDTTRTYKNLFPKAHIIVSTWVGSPSGIIKELRNLGVQVLENKLPSHSGPYNINYQLKGTQAGLANFDQSKISYVIKTRTDQRFYSPEIIDHLKALQKSFPVKSDLLEDRIIVSSFTTLKYRPFSVSDMFVFGRLSDLLLYWDVPFDQREKPVKPFKTVQEMVDFKIAEVYIGSDFAVKNYGTIDLSIANYYKALRDYYCIIDAETIDLYWPKYRMELEYQHRYYNGRHSYDLVRFNDWLDIYTDPFKGHDYVDLTNTIEGDYFE